MNRTRRLIGHSEFPGVVVIDGELVEALFGDEVECVTEDALERRVIDLQGAGDGGSLDTRDVTAT